MKREFSEDNPNPNSTMFSKFHPQPKFQPPQAAAEEADSQSRNADGATIEVVRRPRGRPPGSKNKPKPPVIIQREPSEQTMSPYVLELPSGVDIIDSTNHFCRKRNIGLCILNGNGAVSNVTLKQPSTTPGATVTFHGRFDVLSISATILAPGGACAGDGAFAITLAGPQGQVVGGHVVGPLVSAGTIYLIAANFSNPSFHRLQEVENDGDGGVSDSPSGGGAAVSGGVPMSSYQVSDFVWVPPTRPPPPQQSPPPPY